MTANGQLYQILNKQTGQKYIGVTMQSLRARWGVHLYRLRNQKGTEKLQEAFNRYGEAAFDIEALALGNLDDMYAKEKELTKETVVTGYNMIVGGNDVEERKAATKMLQKKVQENPEFAAAYFQKLSDSTTGKKRSDSTKRKMSKIHKGKTISDAQIKGMKARATGQNNPNYGKHRLYINLQTGIFYTTPELLMHLNTTLSGLQYRFRSKSFASAYVKI